jgi:hypothetical protein
MPGVPAVTVPELLDRHGLKAIPMTGAGCIASTNG